MSFEHSYTIYSNNELPNYMARHTVSLPKFIQNVWHKSIRFYTFLTTTKKNLLVKPQNSFSVSDEERVESLRAYNIYWEKLLDSILVFT